MTQTLDLGLRIELVSMDPHFHDISIALYRPGPDNAPAYKVHTYSQFPGAAERTAGIAAAMQILGGVEQTGGGMLRFSCGHAHLFAVKRLFLEACKLPPAQPIEPRPLHIFDKKANATIAVASRGQGLYEAGTTEQVRGAERRVATIARGLIRLGEMDEVVDQPNQAQFGCGEAHDTLLGLLLVRAPNVRTAVREAEAMASRGVLSAPGAQE